MIVIKTRYLTDLPHPYGTKGTLNITAITQHSLGGTTGKTVKQAGINQNLILTRCNPNRNKINLPKISNRNL
jgi:hypothetical protein